MTALGPPSQRRGCEGAEQIAQEIRARHIARLRHAPAKDILHWWQERGIGKPPNANRRRHDEGAG